LAWRQAVKAWSIIGPKVAARPGGRDAGQLALLDAAEVEADRADRVNRVPVGVTAVGDH
jgi:hypothetical protein